MKYLRVPNWEDYQHYKDRSPPWIKLHNQLLEDFEFCVLPDASKAHLTAIWMLASRTNNKIPYDSGWIAQKISATEAVDLETLLNSGFLEEHPENSELQSMEQSASNVLQDSQVSDHQEERRGEERRDRGEGGFCPPAPPDVIAFMIEKGYPEPQAKHETEKFFYHYEAEDWHTGKEDKRKPMKSWKLSAVNWLQKVTPEPSKTPERTW